MKIREALSTKPRKSHPNNETGLQRAILDALSLDKDVACFRSNTGAMKTEAGRFMRYGLAKGASDIIGIVKCKVFLPKLALIVHGGERWVPDNDKFVLLGRFIALEVKVGKKQPTLEQNEFLALVRRMGGHAAVVRSVNEAMAAVKAAKGM